MNNSNSISKLKELLAELENVNNPSLIRLSNRDGHHYLIDKIVSNVIDKNETKLNYIKIEMERSKAIMEELQIINNPVLLLVNNGDILEAFSGMIGQHQLDSAIQNLHLNLEPQTNPS